MKLSVRPSFFSFLYFSLLFFTLLFFTFLYFSFLRVEVEERFVERVSCQGDLSLSLWRGMRNAGCGMWDED